MTVARYEDLSRWFREATLKAPAFVIPTTQEIVDMLQQDGVGTLFPEFWANDQWLAYIDLVLQGQGTLLDSDINHYHKLSDWRRRVRSGSYTLLQRIAFFQMFSQALQTPIDGMHRQSVIRALKTRIRNHIFRGIRVYDKYPLGVCENSEIFLNQLDYNDFVQIFDNTHTLKAWDVWHFNAVRHYYDTSHCDNFEPSSDKATMVTDELDITKLSFTVFGRTFELAPILRENNASVTPPELHTDPDYIDDPGVNPNSTTLLFEATKIFDHPSEQIWVKIMRTRYFDTNQSNYWERRLNDRVNTFTATYSNGQVTVTQQAVNQSVLSVETVGESDTQIPGKLELTELTHVFTAPNRPLLLTGLKGIKGTQVLNPGEQHIVSSIEIYRGGVREFNIQGGANAVDPYGLHTIKVKLAAPLPGNAVAQIFLQGQGFYGLQQDVFVLSGSDEASVTLQLVAPLQQGKGLITATAVAGCFGDVALEVDVVTPDIIDDYYNIVLSQPEENTFPNITFELDDQSNIKGTYFVYVRIILGYLIHLVGSGCANNGDILRPGAGYPLETDPGCPAGSVTFWADANFYDSVVFGENINVTLVRTTKTNKLIGIIEATDLPDLPSGFPIATVPEIYRQWQVNTMYQNDLAGVASGQTANTDAAKYQMYGVKLWHGFFNKCFADNLQLWNNADVFGAYTDRDARITTDMATLAGQALADWPGITHGADVFPPNSGALGGGGDGSWVADFSEDPNVVDI